MVAFHLFCEAVESAESECKTIDDVGQIEDVGRSAG